MFAMGPAFFKQGGAAALALSGTFAAATVGVAYSSSLTITGGVAPYSLTGGTGVASGSLPAGLSLSISGSSLMLSGTPTTAATSSFTVSVGSTDAQTATSAQSVIVAVLASSCLLHFDGADGATSFVDETGKAWARFGGAGGAALSTAQAKFGAASLYTSGSVDAIYTGSHADFNFGSGDFNIAIQLYPNAGSLSRYQGIVLKDDTAGGPLNRGWLMLVDSGTHKVTFACYVNATPFLVADNALPVAGTFTQYEVERYGGTLTLYKNGTAVSSVSISGALNATTYPVVVGCLFNSGAISANNQYVGWSDELRIRKEAVRKGNFTAPTAPFAA